MRIVPLLDSRVDWHERALWLTVPFDLSIRRPRSVDCQLTVSARLDAQITGASRLDGQVESAVGGRA